MDISVLNLGLSILYYAVVVVVTFLSLFGLYIFIRYGENQKLTVTVGIIYIVLYLILISQGQLLLHSL